jgi:hypothetical protein
MEYQQQILQLKQSIQIIKHLQFTKINNTFDENAAKIRDDFADALQEALTFSYYLNEPKNIQYLKGINDALGSRENISQWMKNTQLLSKTCIDLTKFITKNFPQNTTPQSLIRLQAFNELLIKAGILLLVITIVALITLCSLAFISTPILSILFLAFSIGLLVDMSNKQGIPNSDSLFGLLFYGEHKQDRVNNSLMEKCGIFANPVFENLSLPAEIIVDPVLVIA